MTHRQRSANCLVSDDIQQAGVKETEDGSTIGPVEVSGRYGHVQAPRLMELMAGFASDPDPLNLMPDLALLRGLIAQMIEQCGTAPSRIDLNAAARLVSDIGSVADRIQKQREKTTCSAADVNALITSFALEMVRGVRETVHDEDLRTAIVRAIERRWNAVPAPGSQ